MGAGMAGRTSRRRSAGACKSSAASLGERRRAGKDIHDQRAPLVVIAGPPAAGKGTQCEKIKAQYGFVHLSTGDILRENVRNETELGLEVKAYMDAGALVPSELIWDLVQDRLSRADVKQQGCLLDGFPRTPHQAKAMGDAGLRVACFLLIKVPDDVIVERGCGRRIDPETGHSYHLDF